MKKIELITIFVLVTICTHSVFSQTVDGNIKKKEYVCQVVELEGGRAHIEPNFDYLGKEFWYKHILCDSYRYPTLEDAIDKLTHHGFKVKSMSVKDGKQIITMSILADKTCSKKNIERMFAISEELDRRTE